VGASCRATRSAGDTIISARGDRSCRAIRGGCGGRARGRRDARDGRGRRDARDGRGRRDARGGRRGHPRRGDRDRIPHGARARARGGQKSDENAYVPLYIYLRLYSRGSVSLGRVVGRCLFFSCAVFCERDFARPCVGGGGKLGPVFTRVRRAARTRIAP